MKEDLQNAVQQFQVLCCNPDHLLTTFVLKAPQAETQVLQHLDMGALGEVINDKLGALNIQQYAYTA